MSAAAVRERGARELEVLRPGPLATVQDLGRFGFAEIGVGVSGAADRASMRLANRMVGNSESDAVIEVTVGGLEVRARGELSVAITGAACPVTVDGRGASVNAVLRLRAGSRLTLGTSSSGMRSYLAVRGGLEVASVLGSRATDLLSGLGPPQLSAGQVLAVGEPSADFPSLDAVPVNPPEHGELALAIVPGPRDDWFGESAMTSLLTNPYQVTEQSNRVGMRLAGPPLPRVRTGELPSEGMVPGALQVPPSGQPTMFLADHPVTGGYPVIAVVMAADVDRAAQARPGQSLRFHLAAGFA